MRSYTNTIKKRFGYLTDGDMEKLNSIAVYKKVEKRELWLPCTTTPFVIYVLKGMIRGYLITDMGDERTIFLTQENLFTGDPELLFGAAYSKYNFEAEVNSEVLIFNSKSLSGLAMMNPNISRMMVDALLEIVRILIGRIESLVDKLPEARFDVLIKERPLFFNSALDKHLANYLGISPVSLSRIKRRRKN